MRFLYTYMLLVLLTIITVSIANASTEMERDFSNLSSNNEVLADVVDTLNTQLPVVYEIGESERLIVHGAYKHENSILIKSQLNIPLKDMDTRDIDPSVSSRIPCILVRIENIDNFSYVFYDVNEKHAVTVTYNEESCSEITDTAI